MRYFWVLLLAAAPISELRGAIPLAITYGFSPISAYILGVIGNIIPIIILLKYLGPISEFLSKNFKIFDKFFKWLFERTRSKHCRQIEVWGALALVSFVAIPMPLTGAYTGVAAAFIFCIPPKKSLSLIFTGILIAGLIVTLSTVGFLSFINF